MNPLDSIENLRRELISLVESIHIYSEDDVRAARSGQFDGRVSTVLGRA